MSAILYLVVPCYNDEKTLPASAPVFLEKLEALIGAGTISEKSRLLLINDGSADCTWDTILALQRQNENRIAAIDLAGNFGQQNALIAGMTFARDRADCLITIDSDLQDDINAVDEMLEYYYAGKDVVFGARNDRSNDGLAERFCTKSFYILMKAANTGLVDEHANYQLLSKKAVALLLEDLPANYYLPCVVSNLKVPSAVVTYRRFKRIAGKTGYNLRKKSDTGKGRDIYTFRASAENHFPFQRVLPVGGGHFSAVAVVFRTGKRSFLFPLACGVLFDRRWAGGGAACCRGICL